VGGVATGPAALGEAEELALDRKFETVTGGLVAAVESAGDLLSSTGLSAGLSAGLSSEPLSLAQVVRADEGRSDACDGRCEGACA
jgi:hypothetical protein